VAIQSSYTECGRYVLRRDSRRALWAVRLLCDQETLSKEGPRSLGKEGRGRSDTCRCCSESKGGAPNARGELDVGWKETVVWMRYSQRVGHQVPE
jgi:hypothetical protein